jgi:hypothetical protein
MTRPATTPAGLWILLIGMVAGGLPVGCSNKGIGLRKADAQVPALDAAAGNGGAAGTSRDAATAGSGGSGGVTRSGGVSATVGSTTTGGSAGGGSTTGAGSSTRPGGYPECETPQDCQLVNDCCNCVSMPIGRAKPSCDLLECFAARCDSRYITGASVDCIAGRCTFNQTCNPAGVLCTSPAPACRAGEVPLIVGGCYGPCVRAENCSDVGSCDVCKAAGLSCATFQMPYLSAATPHCVSTPPECAANPTCGCMGICSGVSSCVAPLSTTLTCLCRTCDPSQPPAPHPG